MRSHRCAVLSAALALAIGCEDARQAEPLEVTDRLGAWAPDAAATILRTGLSQLDDPTFAVVADTGAWRTMWARAWYSEQLPDLPPMDFVLSSVLVVGLGRRGASGYSVAIDSIVARTVGSTLYATETQPGSHCSRADSTSAPVHMVRAPGHPAVVEWRVGTVTHDCGSAAPAP